MPRRTARPEPTRRLELAASTRACPTCGGPLWAAYKSQRSVITLDGPVRLAVQVRSCRDADCPRYRAPLRSEREGRFALPQHEFGLDVVALVGALRHAEHRSVPEIHAELVRRGVEICVRSVSNLLDRYDELLALALADPGRIRRLTETAGRVILAIDGLQPDVGHEVLWVVRDVLSGEVLLARSLLSGTRADLAGLLGEVKDALRVPIIGVVSDGQQSLVRAIADVLPGVPHQRCQFHYLREAARPIYEADRHAKVALKKRVRGVRPIERSLEGRDDAEAVAARGYCAAVRSALTDDGRPPLEASGLKLQGRLRAVADSLERVAARGGSRRR
jgi:Transposase, Mutator family